MLIFMIVTIGNLLELSISNFKSQIKQSYQIITIMKIRVPVFLKMMFRVYQEIGVVAIAHRKVESLL